MSRPSSPSSSHRDPLQPLIPFVRSSNSSTSSAKANGVIPGFTATQAGQEIAHAKFHSARNEDSRRVVSDSNGGRNMSDKKRHRLSGGFLLQPFTKRSKSKREPLTALDNQVDGTPTAIPEREDNNELLDKVVGSQARSTGILWQEENRSIDGGRRSFSTQARDRKGKSRVSSAQTNFPSSSTPGSSPSAWQRKGWISEERPISRASAGEIDPSQIVRMALSLNESRRLGLTPGQLPSTGSLVSRRVTSAGLGLGLPEIARRRQSMSLSPNPSTPRSAKGSTRLPEAATEASRSPSTSHLNRRISTASPLPSALFDSHVAQEPQVHLSAATILRAERARTFFELSREYHRLLETLPPLSKRGQSSSNGALGREYNPLQYMRNRKVRNRERLSLDGSKAGWDVVDQVQGWVDEVELGSQEPNYFDGDVVNLPPWHRPFRRTDTIIDASSPTNARSPEGQDAKPGSRLDWRIVPADLLADAYWLEHDDHKALIEDKNGQKLFKRFHRAKQMSISESAGRRSMQSSEVSGPNEALYPASNYTTASPPNALSNPSDTDEGLHLGISKHRSRTSRTSRMKRHILRRKPTISDEQSSDTADEDGMAMRSKRHLSPTDSEQPNTAPLEKHMRMMLEKESPNISAESLPPRSTSDGKGNHRRGGVSEELKDLPRSRRESHLRNDSYSAASPRSSQDGSIGTPRISVEDYDDGKHQLRNYFTNESSRTNSMVARAKAFPFSFMHKRTLTKEQNNIADHDFATSPIKMRHSIDSGRSSLAPSSRSDSYRSLPETVHGPYRNESQDDLVLSPASTGREAPMRFFKGGRIGELVRTELPPKADFVWKKQPPSKDGKRELSPLQNSSDDDCLLSARHHRLSSSATDLRHGQYIRQHLPTFKSSHNTGRDTLDDASSSHITDQQQAIREKKKSRRSRFDRLSPLDTETSADVSPNTSQPDLTSYQDHGSLRPVDGSQRRGESRSSSSSGVRVADQRLNQMLREPGLRGRKGLPVTGLSNIDAKRRTRDRGPGAWNIADDHAATGVGMESKITIKDIAYVRTLFASSGIKAQAFVRRANAPPKEPAAFLVKAFENAGRPYPENIGRRFQHVVAARLLSESLDNTIASFKEDADHFINITSNGLQARIDDLREMVGSKLTPEVRSCGDDADSLIAKLTTAHTLAAKQVNENIELMMRSRWRRVRWFRKVGFGTLEWVLVGFMWWIWLLVLIIRAVLAIFRGFSVTVKWLLWIL